MSALSALLKDIYPVLLYLHLLFVAAAFSASALLHFGALRMRGAERAAIALDGAGVLRRVGPLMPLFSIGLLVSGALLVQAAWSWKSPWVLAAVGALLLMKVIGAAAIQPAMPRLAGMLVPAVRANPTAPVPADFARAVRAPRFWTAFQLQPALALGIMCLMVVKPGAVGSVATLLAFMAAGALAAVPLWRRAPATGALTPVATAPAETAESRAA